MILFANLHLMHLLTMKPNILFVFKKKYITIYLMLYYIYFSSYLKYHDIACISWMSHYFTTLIIWWWSLPVLFSAHNSSFNWKCQQDPCKILFLLWLQQNMSFYLGRPYIPAFELKSLLGSKETSERVPFFLFGRVWIISVCLSGQIRFYVIP